MMMPAKGRNRDDSALQRIDHSEFAVNMQAIAGIAYNLSLIEMVIGPNKRQTY